MEGNYGRGGGSAGGRGRGRGRGGGGRGNYQNQPNQGGGRGRGGSSSQPPVQQQWGNRPPVEGHQSPAPPQAWGNRPPANQSGGRGRGGSQPAQQQWVNRPPVQGSPAPPQAWGNRPPQTQPHQQGGGAWTGRPWGQSPPPTPSVQPAPPTPSVQPAPPIQTPPKTDELGMPKRSTQKTVASSSGIKETQFQPIRRPDSGGTVFIRRISLLVNHFLVNFNPESTILHYDVDVKPVSSSGQGPVKKTVRKSDMRSIRDKLFSDDPKRFPLVKTAYDGEKNIFSSVHLPTGQFNVVISDGEEAKSGTYTVAIKLVNELKLSKVNDYINGNLSYIPRDILQGMDLVMKDNPSRKRVAVGRSFYSPEYRREDDLHYGIAAYRGFQQSLKPTSQGLIMCLDFSVLAFRKAWPVIDFLKEHLPHFQGVNDVKRMKREVNNVLKGLKVRVTHRKTKQKYTIAGLTSEDARDTYFDLEDPEGKNPTERVSLVQYFRNKWGKDILHQNIPCLEVGKNNRSNKVPMEFCVLVEGQRFPKEYMDKDMAAQLKRLSLLKSWDRKNTINEMVRASDGPCGEVTRNFEFGVDVRMTEVQGRVIGAPELKLGNPRSVRVDGEKCQWNLVGKSLVDGKVLDRWVLLDFTEGDRYNKLQVGAFVNNLKGRCRNLGINMADPVLHHTARMSEFSSANRIDRLLNYVVEESRKITNGKLQMMVCAMTKRDPGYKYLKWISETRIGVITQCCLSNNANKGQDQYLANLCLKINAKLGGSNFELIGKLPRFETGDHVMFIGADVNHPAPMNKSCPSIAAVVGTVNWPAANRYAARVRPQAHRTENIVSFGSMCLDLINAYARLNKVKPNRIVVFRDGVSEGQFEMVLAQELLDLKEAIYDDHYQPAITLVVAQKRHQTRLFLQNRNDGGATGNVPPGTVVDTKIIHPRDFDFYLCSHYGGLGTSKPTHYYVLWDENSFSSDELQKLIYDMCFTFARCTKPVSLVPPVYYADLVAYRGRMFQEAVMESGTSSRHAPPSGDSFDQSFYSMHADLENVMFFV